MSLPYPPECVCVLLSEFEGLRFHLWLSRNLSLMQQLLSFPLWPGRTFNKILIKNKIPFNKAVHLLPGRCNRRRLIFGELNALPTAVQGWS